MPEPLITAYKITAKDKRTAEILFRDLTSINISALYCTPALAVALRARARYLVGVFAKLESEASE